MKKSRVFVNSPDSFCYVCGEFTAKSQHRPLSDKLKQAYYYYFECNVCDEDKSRAPHMCCTTCYSKLINWMDGEKTQSMSFAVPMIWREPTSHAEDCYFCLTKITGFSKKTRSKIEYPNVPSAIRPVPPGPKLPVPNPPSQLEELVLPIEQTDDLAQPSTSSDQSYSPEHHKEPHLIQQCELNNLIRDLNLT
ncbi:hypothetical protein ANN_00216 [Periplaneta americana]|uniref:Uncharacterized protein n=1 Tax=Periplaneta americana TaxID=6978 RepID=A0ABQ8TQ83_PERAM|nr:hypothetical protein ANN_00216 [Periplaneta americana]